MKLLIAHGDETCRYLLRGVAEDLRTFDVEPVESVEGAHAVALLTGDDAPDLAVVDWDLPGITGPELCRRVRASRRAGSPYIILLARTQEQVGEALAAGADDCFRAGAGRHELAARICAARRLRAIA